MILKYNFFLERKDLDESVTINNFYNSIVEQVSNSLDTGKGIKLGNNLIVFELNVNEDKLSFTDKIKIRLFGKLLNKYADKVSGAMDTADILAICALVSGILALISYYGSFLFGIAAIVLGVIALKKGTSKRGMALAGIIMGAIGLLFWILFIAVIAAILI
jgi:hypothetical protein